MDYRLQGADLGALTRKETDMYQKKVILEIARGDSIEELLAAGVIEPRRFWDASGCGFDSYGVCGGTPVEATVDGNTITFGGVTKKKNAYGFAHGQRSIHVQSGDHCFIHADVFIG